MSLAEVVTAAFPRDWRAHHPTAEQALAGAVANLSGAARARARGEVDRIARQRLCEVQLDALIAFELGSHLAPAEMGLTPAGWLAWLGAGLRDADAEAASGVVGGERHG